jgi:hypothetical protein
LSATGIRTRSFPYTRLTRYCYRIYISVASLRCSCTAMRWAVVFCAREHHQGELGQGCLRFQLLAVVVGGTRQCRGVVENRTPWSKEQIHRSICFFPHLIPFAWFITGNVLAVASTFPVTTALVVTRVCPHARSDGTNAPCSHFCFVMTL